MDALILLAVVAVAAILLYVFVLSEKMSINTIAGTDHVKVSYVVEITNISTEFDDKVSVGESVTDSSKKMPIGTVTAVESQPYVYMGKNLTRGEFVLNTVEDRISLYVTVEADAVLDGISYNIDGYEIYVGKQVHMAFHDLVCSGYCISMDVQN